ncbi:hypothetical protein K501DRAFT_50700 [Backusella circina FSU 941]|nr:hypothetical protein K501DRAFT_50700 [Backusella circina FSU 941]
MGHIALLIPTNKSTPVFRYRRCFGPSYQSCFFAALTLIQLHAHLFIYKKKNEKYIAIMIAIS